MPNIDIWAMLAVGIAFYIGALQMKPQRIVPLLLLAGWISISVGIFKLFWGSDGSTWLIPAIIIIASGVLAIVSGYETHRSLNVQDYIRIWERNFENWDGGKPNDRLDLTEQKIDGQIVLARMRLPIEKNPARFTPIFQSLHDSIKENAQVWLTIDGNGLKFEDDQNGEWRQVLSDTSRGGRYSGKIDFPIYAGQNKWGPDGVIKIHFPIGLYKIKYEITGVSMKDCEFRKEGHFLVDIYSSIQNS